MWVLLADARGDSSIRRQGGAAISARFVSLGRDAGSDPVGPRHRDGAPARAHPRATARLLEQQPHRDRHRDLEAGSQHPALREARRAEDRHLVKPLSDGALLAAADGLGHGHEAALAADLAVRTAERHAGLSLIEIMERCHQSLIRTRGVALSLARWDAKQKTMTWLGVGNVEGLLLRPDSDKRPVPERLLLRLGVVGARLPGLQEARVEVPGTGVLIFTTDGIASGFELGLDPRVRPQPLADQILARHSRGTDDALVLVARLSG